MENLPERIYMESSRQHPDDMGLRMVFHTDINRGGYEYISAELHAKIYADFLTAEKGRIQALMNLQEIMELVKGFAPEAGKDGG